MATQAQRDLVDLNDPLVFADPGCAAQLDNAIDLAASRLSRALYGNQFDLAVALAAICTLRRRNPNVGGGSLLGVTEAQGGARSKSSSNMPPGFPADWYTCPAGEELIGLTFSLTPPIGG